MRAEHVEERSERITTRRAWCLASGGVLGSYPRRLPGMNIPLEGDSPMSAMCMTGVEADAVPLDLAYTCNPPDINIQAAFLVTAQKLGEDATRHGLHCGTSRRSQLLSSAFPLSCTPFPNDIDPGPCSTTVGDKQLALRLLVASLACGRLGVSCVAHVLRGAYQGSANATPRPLFDCLIDVSKCLPHLKRILAHPPIQDALGAVIMTSAAATTAVTVVVVAMIVFTTAAVTTALTLALATKDVTPALETAPGPGLNVVLPVLAAVALRALFLAPPEGGTPVRQTTEQKYELLFADIANSKGRGKWNTKTCDGKRLQKYARLLPRVFGPFVRLHAIITTAVFLCATSDPEEEAERSDSLIDISAEDKVYAKHVFEWLLKRVPFMRPMLSRLDAEVDDVILLGCFLDHHANTTRGNDINKVKTHLREFVPSVEVPRTTDNVDGHGRPLVITPGRRSDEEKDGLGFRSLWSLRLLIPQSMLSQFMRDPPDLYGSINSRGAATVFREAQADAYYPSFLYDESPIYDMNNLFEGLFKSKFLITMYRVLFTSYSSVKTGPSVSGTGRPSVSESFGLSQVAPESIAYVACLIYFVLSDVHRWTPVLKGFSLPRFFRNIVTILSSSETPFGAEILAYWKREVYGEDVVTDPVEDTEDTTVLNQTALILEQLIVAHQSHV
ncbi:uncharacterized protein BXZ73DRAFT_80427 [Epithele typhae]|uniref:uncharacterized protein n=1 Tax=Epithele typhae TaxID=378194 RepID=UPI00200796C9|nr:uncharacterized protein BXZ73DRAFT_80427 [Epithele typhae]KAH9918887.1 hypothetical protein BXZ73DRAFT_80427 [Epithele typhae]